MLVTVTTTGGVPAGEPRLVHPRLHQSHQGTHTRPCTRAQLASPPGRAGGSRRNRREQAKTQSLPRPAARPTPRFPPSARLARKPGMRPRAATSRGCARSHLTRRKGKSDPRILPALSRAPTVPNHLRTLRGRSKSRDAPGAPSTTREEAPYQVGTPPDTTRLENPVHAASHKAEAPVHHRNPALFLEKPPPPLSLQYTHLRLGAVLLAPPAAVPRHVHACARCLARLAPLGSRRPQPACAHKRGGATSRGAQFPRLPPPGVEL